MKMHNIALVALTLGLGAFTLLAQDEPAAPGGPLGAGGEFHGPRGGPPPPGPILIVLDVNEDGTLDATEIANASTALLKLDKNGDGILTLEELRPPPPGGTNQFQLRPRRGGRHPVPPLVAALDVNRDGQLDATEIANASAALLKLDANGDGSLTREELCPRPPRGAGGPGGPPPEDGPVAPGAPDDSSQPSTQ
jgi:hypothetical protein